MKYLILIILILTVSVYCQSTLNIPKGEVIEGFEDINEWTPVDDRCYNLQDLVHFTEGASSLKFVASTAQNAASAIRKVALNLQDYEAFSIDLYMPDIPKKTINFRIEFSSTDFSQTYFRADITAGTRVYKGWNRLVFSKNDFTYVWGPESWMNTMTSLRISEWVVGDTSSLILDNFRAYRTKATPVAIITFDDGMVTQKTIAKPILDSLGIKATMFVIGSFASSTNKNYLRWPSLDSLYKDGWDLANHTYTHVRLSTLSVQQQDFEINGMRDTLIARGYSRSADFLAYPFGDLNPEIIQKAREKHKLARSIYNWKYLNHPAGLSDDYYLVREHNELAEFDVHCQDIDMAISRGQLLIYLFHDISSYTGKFSAIMHYLREKQDAGLIQIMTMSEYYNQLITAMDTPAANTNLPSGFSLSQNYPNPFNPLTTINYVLEENSRVILRVYDLLGREVQTLFSGVQNKGKHSVEFNASRLPSGIYFYRLETPKSVISRKMTVLK